MPLEYFMDQDDMLFYYTWISTAALGYIISLASAMFFN
jgi:hypothetical protein